MMASRRLLCPSAASLAVAVAVACGGDGVPAALEEHAEEYAAAQQSAGTRTRFGDYFAWTAAVDSFTNPYDHDDVRGYVAGRIVPVDVDARTIDADVYQALPESLRATSDADAGTIVQIQWSGVGTNKYREGGTGKEVDVPMGRGGAVVVIDRARDSIVGMWSDNSSGPVLLKSSKGFRGKAIVPLIAYLTTLSKQPRDPLPDSVVVTGVLADAGGSPTRDADVIVVRWTRDSSGTVYALHSSGGTWRRATSARDGRFTVTLTRAMMLRSWRAGYGRYAVVAAEPDDASGFAREAGTPLRFTLAPGAGTIDVGVVRRSR